MLKGCAAKSFRRDYGVAGKLEDCFRNKTRTWEGKGFHRCVRKEDCQHFYSFSARQYKEKESILVSDSRIHKVVVFEKNRSSWRDLRTIKKCFIEGMNVIAWSCINKRRGD